MGGSHARDSGDCEVAEQASRHVIQEQEEAHWAALSALHAHALWLKRVWDKNLRRQRWRPPGTPGVPRPRGRALMGNSVLYCMGNGGPGCRTPLSIALSRCSLGAPS